ncbi:response regulator [Candidatus Sumerlaeota bacterium]|nr:response regulator [Candidatus Sumerlaeota bacterium]
MTPRIFIIDDDPDFLEIMTQFLKKEQYETAVSSHPENIMEDMQNFRPDLVISDIMMPGVTGSFVYEEIRNQCTKTLPVIICSATSMKLKNVKDSLLDYCPKPVNFPTLKEILIRLLGQTEEQEKDSHKP